MSDPAQNQKKSAVELFVASIPGSAHTLMLYAPTHPMVMQIAERANNYLLKTLGQENNLTLEIKGKSVIANEVELSETKDILNFANALHTLGIGQVLFTNRLTKEGMYEFLKILNLKADEKNSLTDLQKGVQQTRIDGLQLTFILSFVVTGETDDQGQKPGELNEGQILSYIKTDNLPDFLMLLLKQNENLNGKKAEAITNLLEGALLRETSTEKFEQSMAWSDYDPRIRAHWDSLVQKLGWKPKFENGKRISNGSAKWERPSLISQAALFQNGDLEAQQTRVIHEKNEAVKFSLDKIRELIEKPLNQEDPLTLTAGAYTRLLGELSNDGNVHQLLEEFKRWQTFSKDEKTRSAFEKIRGQIQKKLISPAFAENFVIYLAKLEPKTAEFNTLESFILFVGDEMIPLLLEELRKLSDKTQRMKFCNLLVTIAKQHGTRQFIPALKDQDWFLVRNVVMIIGETGPDNAPTIAQMLNHSHPRVREESIRMLGKVGGQVAVISLGSFITHAVNKPEEIAQAITAVSLLVEEGVDKKLIDAFGKVPTYDLQVAIVTALGRVQTEYSQNFVRAVSKKSFMEMITGRNKALRRAARESYDQLKKG